EIAAEVGLPVFVHDRDSNGEVAETLKRYRSRLSGAVVHCFTGTAQDLKALLDLDCYIGITGWVTEKKRGAGLRDIIGALPLERLLIETDAPFLLPRNLPKGWHAEHAPGISSRRNEPALLSYVAAGVADAMDLSVEAVVEASSANARRLFGL
ncbi:MAG: TatD family hydrolase, partial [Pseudomonadota bacterium]